MGSSLYSNRDSAHPQLRTVAVLLVVSQSIQVGPISLKYNIILPNDERNNRPTWIQSTLAFKQGCHIEHKNFLFKSIKGVRIVNYPTKGQGLKGENFDTGAQLVHVAMNCTFLQNFLDSV